LIPDFTNMLLNFQSPILDFKNATLMFQRPILNFTNGILKILSLSPDCRIANC